ncbi:MAG: insulinase family protein [bacterium]
MLLVSDVSADKSAASLNVHVGSSADPQGQNGLAHFLEHMLFLGTDTYPEPDEYQAFLTRHGGTYNAFTAFRDTNYFFDVDPEFFIPALDRFSRFFVAPLFNAEYVDREKQAVHSEYQARIKHEGRRQLDALQQAFNPLHPASSFSVGSLDTLKDAPDQSLRDQLLTFYERHYTASNMTLVVVAPENLDTLETEVRQRFSEIPDRPVTQIPYPESILQADQLPQMIEIRPEERTRSVDLFFDIPDDESAYHQKPVAYVANLLGYEGEGSLLQGLKNCGWAESLGAGKAFNDGQKALLNLSVSLTEAGLENWRSVLSVVFHYTDLVRSRGVQQWRFNEQAQLANIQFDYAENSRPMGTALRLAMQLREFAPEDVLSGPYLMETFSRESIDQILAALVPARTLVMKVSDDFEAEKDSPFYQVPYRISSLDVPAIAGRSLPDCAANIRLPDENPYIPDDFSLALKDNERSDIESLPERLSLPEMPKVNVWHSVSHRFPVPKAQVQGKISTPVVDSADGAARLALYLAMVTEQLNSETYPAFLAGLGFTLSPSREGIEFAVTGFSDKLPLLVDRVIEALVETANAIDPEVLARVKGRLADDWRNRAKQEPYRQLINRFPENIANNVYDPAALAYSIEGVDGVELRDFALSLLRGTDRGLGLQLLINGNIDKKSARRLTASIIDKIPAVAAGYRSPQTVAEIDESVDQAWQIDHTDSAILRYVQAPGDNLEDAATFSLLRQIIKSAFFDDLRTEQQLGYVVSVVDLTMDHKPGIGFLVQSPKVGSQVLSKKIDEFLDGYQATVRNMPDAEFENYKNGLIAQLTERAANLAAQSADYWADLELGYTAFDRRERLAEAVRGIERSDIETQLRAISSGYEKVWQIRAEDFSDE